MTTLHLTLKMIAAQVVEMSVTSNSLSEDYSHQDDHFPLDFVIFHDNFNIVNVFLVSFQAKHISPQFLQ